MNARNEHGETPLFLAAKNRFESVIKALIEKGADVNIKTNTKATPLHWISYWGLTDFVKILLEKGAHVDVRDSLRKTPLYYSASHGKFAIENCV